MKDDLFDSHLDFLDTSSDNVSEDEILDYLAQIVASIYIREVEKETIMQPHEDTLPDVQSGE